VAAALARRPTRPRASSRAQPLARRRRGGAAAEGAGDRPTEAAARGASPQPAAFEKTRLTRRGVYDREIVQLDEQARVVQALLGRDLSVDGIRVARQLGLTPGDKLRLALFDASQKEPLMLAAEVCRDDGGSGLFLRYIDVPPATSARIGAIVKQLPPVEAIDPHASVAPAEILSDQQ
jgi:hypothetical protein